MGTKGWLVTAGTAVGAAAIIAGLFFGRLSPPSDRPWIADGEILSIGEDDRLRVRHVSTEEGRTQDYVRVTWLAVVASEGADGSYTRLSVDELERGVHVSIWGQEGVLQSHPGQGGTARYILVDD